MPFRGMVVVFNSFEEAAPQKRSKRSKRGRETFGFFYLAGIFLNPSTLFPVLALFFTRESCLTPEIQAHNRKTSLQKLAAMTEKG